MSASPDAGPRGEVWVYTSVYQSVLDALDPVVREALPDVEVRWYQAGSEKVAQRVETEWAAGGSPACLLMTSDPFWYVRLADEGRLQSHFAPNVLEVDRSMVDPAARWVGSRVSLVVLAVNHSIPAGSRPTSFAALADARWVDQVTMPDPLASGTAFTWLAFQDPALIAALHQNRIVAAGGNSAVLNRVASGERPVGVVLLENVLASDGAPVDVVYPTDGAVAVPGPIALTAGCPNPVAARALYDLLLSPVGQRLLVGGDMYAALPALPPPDGAPPLAELAVRPWSAGFAASVTADQARIKDAWAAAVAE